MPKRTFENKTAVKSVLAVIAALLCTAVFLTVACSRKQQSEKAVGIYASDLYVSGYACSNTSGAQSSSFPTVSAVSAALMIAETQDIIFSKNADRKMPMASTTKIMTALVAIKKCNIASIVVIPQQATGIAGSSVYLRAGERLTLEELLYAMLLESANDAATAIAIFVGGSVDSFADMMNNEADLLGLQNTHFTNPHGLDDTEHYTTARELAVIAAAAMQNETFRKIVSTYKKTIPLNGNEGVRLLINHNKLLNTYDGSTGIKTGYTKKSGRCLVSSAQRNGLELICVTLNAADDWNDHTRLLEYGFASYESKILCKSGELKYVLPVIGGDCEYAVLQNKQELRAIVPKNGSDIECTVALPRFIYAPVESGYAVGKCIFTFDGKTVAECALTSQYSIERITYDKSLLKKLFSLFNR